MNIGDLVTHKFEGGVGIITDTRWKHSNITLGVAKYWLIHWIERGGNGNRTLYMPAYLEVIDPTDKNCPSK